MLEPFKYKRAWHKTIISWTGSVSETLQYAMQEILRFHKKKEIKTTFWRNLIRVMVEVLTEVEFKVSAASLLNQLFEGPKQLNS